MVATTRHARNEHGRICNRCTVLGRTVCRCAEFPPNFSAASMINEFRDAQARENRHLALLCAFVALVIFVGVYFAS